MISMDKKYQTRDGHPVRILCVDGPDENYPVIGIIDNEGEPSTWTKEGYYIQNSVEPDYNDLVEVNGWVNIYRHNVTNEIEFGRTVWRTKEEAEKGTTRGFVEYELIARIPVSFNEGDGL